MSKTVPRPVNSTQSLTMYRMFSSLERPVRVVVEQLLPHFDEIQKNWKTMLRDRLKFGLREIRALSGIKLKSQYDNLRSGEFKAYAEALKELGELLERRSVPVDHAVAALELYFEACLPFFNVVPPHVPIASVVRFLGASEFFLILGFSRMREERWSVMEQRLIDAEQRLRRFSVHIVSVYEQTGRRIARDLHDEIGHNLLVLKLYLELMSMDLKEGHPDHVGQKLDEAVSLIGHAIEGVRRLAFNLGPAILEEAGFVPTLRRYAKQFTDRTGIKAQFNVQLTVKIPSIFEVTLYRVMQGVLSNVVEHSGAGSVRIALQTKRGKLQMSVQDDGKGFDVKKTLKDPSQAFGLLTIRQRVELMGGHLRIESSTRRSGRPLHGTRIEVEIPLEDIEAA